MNESDKILIIGEDLPLRDKINVLPSKPGVYQFKNVEGKVIYVGKAQNLRNRIRQYFSKSFISDPKTSSMIPKITDIEFTVTDNEVEALILESNLIKKLRPRYNVILKDDKSYPYIVVTNEPFPRIFVTRKKLPGAKYFGPYTDVKSMRQALKTVRDTFYVRSCNYDLTEDSIAKKKFKVCLDYHIKKCEGPCEGFVSQKHYKDMINLAMQVLTGRINKLVNNLKEEMESLSNENRFEEAAILRDRIKALEVYAEKQKMIDPKGVDRDIMAVVCEDDDGCAVIFKIREGKLIHSQHLYLTNVREQKEYTVLERVIETYYIDEFDIPDEIILSGEIEEVSIIRDWLEKKCDHKVNIEVPRSGEKERILKLAVNNARFWLDELKLIRQKRGEAIPKSILMLQKDIGLSIPPRRIECFDISNLYGVDNVGSLVVFIDGKPKKSEYRRFKVKSIDKIDDYASLREVIERRYKRVIEESEALPDLIVIDGGKGQLSSAVEILNKLDINNISIIGLAKKLEEIFLPSQTEPLVLPRTSSSLRLLQHIRDEAHRFALQYHRLLRNKRVLHTELDLVKGIGKKRASELLESFGSVQGVKFATEEQLAEIVGKQTAQRIKEYFNEEESQV